MIIILVLVALLLLIAVCAFTAEYIEDNWDLPGRWERLRDRWRK